MTHAIRAEQLVHRYGDNTVLSGLNLAIEPGSVYALIGSNGAGKSTLIHILMNLIRPSAGEAEVLGVPCRNLGPDTLTRIGYVSESQEMIDAMSVGAWMRYIRGFYPNWNDATAEALLKDFGLPLDRKLKHLSRGMRMKAALASSLAYEPELLILDEPFTGLDPQARDEFTAGLLGQAERLTILISSHDLNDVESFASHVGLLEDGRMRFSDDIATLQRRFREVRLSYGGSLPSPWPAEWMPPEQAGSQVRFVVSDFDPESTPARIHQLFPGAGLIDLAALDLRGMFVAHGRTRKQQANGSLR